jgi:hypothetical protein
VSRGEQGARASQGLVEGEALDLEGGCRRRVSTAKRFIESSPVNETRRKELWHIRPRWVSRSPDWTQ